MLTPHRCNEEERFVKSFITKSENESWVLCHEWARMYSDALQSKTVCSTPIDNSKVIDKSGRIKEKAKLDTHYILVSDKVWHIISSLYGGGPAKQIDLAAQLRLRMVFPPLRLENNSNYCYMNACKIYRRTGWKSPYLILLPSGIQSIYSIAELNIYFAERKYKEVAGLDTKKKVKRAAD